MKISQVGLAIDIDDTIAHTAHDRFQQMKNIFGNPGYNFEDHEKHVERVNHIRIHEEAQQRMKTKIHDNEYQKNITVFPYALESVLELHKRSPFNCYITARPDSVIKGTQARLKKHGFPDLPLIAKPVSIAKDKEHLRKAETLYNLYEQGVIGIIDDQIKLIEQMEENFPNYQGTIHIIGKDTKINTGISHTTSKTRNELKHKFTNLPNH